MTHSKTLTIALAGNPNSGKTTIFNNLTGTRQKVGNWPGVTVEKKEGNLDRFGYDLKIIDLPGTYSLTAFSLEEVIARDFILDESPGVVVDIIDATNLERSLYLATQLRELDTKVIFVLNMSDMALERDIKIDERKLSELLDVPVVYTVGNRNEGIDDLLKKVIEVAESSKKLPMERRVKYSKDIEKAITQLSDFIANRIKDDFPYDVRWIVIKLLEDDIIIKKRVLKEASDHAQIILEETRQHRERLARLYNNEDPGIVMTEERYGFIAGIIKKTLKISKKRRVDVSRNIDLVLTNRFLGFPIFIFFVWIMFQMTFTLGSYPMEWIESGIELISGIMGNLLPGGLFSDLIINGVIAGVGSVAIFLPNILILFLFIAIFEDTGYMARAAFLMDKIMHLIGLHGKSFIPMLMGFGCNVPAIMATRTLESEKDRILSVLINPFMSCSARLPIYILLAGTFFAERAGNVIFSIYLLGIVTAILVGRILRSTLLRGDTAPFVMELPPYRMPMFNSLMIHMWDRSVIFIKKMGGIILIGSVVVWALSTFPQDIQFSRDYDAQIRSIEVSYRAKVSGVTETARETLERARDVAIAKLESTRSAEKAEKSYLGRIGKTMAPVFAPLGIDWRGSIALLTGFVAKEIVVSTMGVLYAVGDEEEGEVLKNTLKTSGMTPLSAYAMMVFILLYIPCLATVAAIRRETNSWKWASFSVVFNLSLAWIMAFAIYQGGALFILHFM
ncbi:MAG: ferrous iron transport protein B [Thermodesulfobacteriota bacterium]|nr:ferrous iron transport protein B [Thermodesulfobacteriota bacterium]